MHITPNDVLWVLLGAVNGINFTFKIIHVFKRDKFIDPAQIQAHPAQGQGVFWLLQCKFHFNGITSCNCVNDGISRITIEIGIVGIFLRIENKTVAEAIATLTQIEHVKLASVHEDAI